MVGAVNFAMVTYLIDRDAYGLEKLRGYKWLRKIEASIVKTGF